MTSTEKSIVLPAEFTDILQGYQIICKELPSEESMEILYKEMVMNGVSNVEAMEFTLFVDERARATLN